MSVIHLDVESVEEKLSLHRRRAYILICRSDVEADPKPSLREAKKELKLASGDVWGTTKSALLRFISLDPGDGMKYRALLDIVMGFDDLALKDLDSIIRK